MDWTGREATALRKALRLSTEQFGRQLRVAPRTINQWSTNPEVVPRSAVQDALDGLLENAPHPARTRFDELIGNGSEPTAQVLRVAIAIVLNGPEVLLVRRLRAERDLKWQFPAGMVKPSEDPEDVAARETLAETGVHCLPQEHVGARLHPVTGVTCDYYLCEYLGGTAGNLDPAENSDVAWALRSDVTRYVPRETIYPPVLRILEDPHDRASAR